MALTLVSWRGISFAAAGFAPSRPVHPAVVPAAMLLSVERSGIWGQPVGKQFPAQTYSFILQFSPAQREQQISFLEQWFDPTDNVFAELVATDGTNEWSLWGTPLSCAGQGEDTVIVNIAVKEPYWTRRTPNNSSWAITASGQTKQVTIASPFARPKLTITPTSSKSASPAYRKFIGVYNSMTANWGIQTIDIMNALWDSAALVTGGKLNANGYDLEVYVDGVKVPRWIGNVNTSTSRIWVNLKLPGKRVFKLDTAIAGTGSISVIDVKETDATRNILNDLKGLPQTGILLIDSEYFTYKACQSGKFRFTGVIRAAKLSSMASHSVGANVIYIPHDIWIAYGVPGATAPLQDESLVPVFNLNTSTNAKRVYDNIFATNDGTKVGPTWRPFVYRDSYNGTEVYGDTLAGEPSNDYYRLGMEIASQYVQNGWKAETGTVGWLFQHPGGVKQVEIPTNGATKYRFSTSWPVNAKLQYSLDGVAWTTLRTISTPAFANTPQLFSITLATLTTRHKYFRILFSGTVSALADNRAYLEVSLINIYLDPATVPTFVASTETGGYLIAAKITLVETGEQLAIVAMTDLTKSIVLDCREHTVTRAEDDTPVDAAVYLYPPRAEWFKFQKTPSSGVNTLQWVEANVTGVTVSIDTYEIQYAK